MRKGFTLIEVLATTALAALLLLAAFKVTGSLARVQRAVFTQHAADTRTPQLLEMIRWDLANARFIRADRGKLSLVGYGAFDPADFGTDHRPVHVAYRVRTAAGLTWLVREQTMLDGDRARSTQLVCSGVSSFRVQPVVRPGASVTPSGRDADPAAQSGWSFDEASGSGTGLRPPRGHEVVPDRLRLIVDPDGAAGVHADELIFIR